MKVPERCLVCDAEYIGGHEFPRNKMKVGLRIFYACGGSLSIKEELEYGYVLLCKCPEQISEISGE